jgi:hypothetical protein
MGLVSNGSLEVRRPYRKGPRNAYWRDILAQLAPAGPGALWELDLPPDKTLPKLYSSAKGACGQYAKTLGFRASARYAVRPDGTETVVIEHLGPRSRAK